MSRSMKTQNSNNGKDTHLDSSREELPQLHSTNQSTHSVHIGGSGLVEGSNTTTLVQSSTGSDFLTQLELGDIHAFDEVSRLHGSGPVPADSSSNVTMATSSGGLHLTGYQEVDYSQITTQVEEVGMGGGAGIPPRKRSRIDPENPDVLDETSSNGGDFDPSSLITEGMLQGDDMTTRLALSGPVGMAAAAAIVSGCKKKKSYTFESNPAVRKRHKTKLLKRLKDTVHEFSTRVGMQACIVTFQPGKTAEFEVFGADPLCTIVKKHRDNIVEEMNSTLNQGVMDEQTKSSMNLFELPPLVFNGIPTPVQMMTQAQLRNFIPFMLRYSQNRGKPGWGRDGHKPIWWPDHLPWENIRSDPRPPEDRTTNWTDALREIVISCYAYHGRLDLLPKFTPEEDSEEGITQPVDQQLKSMEGEQGLEEPTQGDATSSSQVFTIDTGSVGQENEELATLSDASLADTAVRLQQVADETGQVQYATQTVTVSDRDAQALGQPAGTTTTVLLTAYPGGQRVPEGESEGQVFTEEASHHCTVQAHQTTASPPIIDPPTTYNPADELKDADQYLNKSSFSF